MYEVFPTSLGMIFSGFLSIYLGVISQFPSDHNLKPAILGSLSPDRHKDRQYLVPLIGDLIKFESISIGRAQFIQRGGCGGNEIEH